MNYGKNKQSFPQNFKFLKSFAVRAEHSLSGLVPPLSRLSDFTARSRVDTHEQYLHASASRTSLIFDRPPQKPWVERMEPL